MTLLDSSFRFEFEKKNEFLTFQVIASVSGYTKIWKKYKIASKFLASTDVYIVAKCPRTDNKRNSST